MRVENNAKSPYIKPTITPVDNDTQSFSSLLAASMQVLSNGATTRGAPVNSVGEIEKDSIYNPKRVAKSSETPNNFQYPS